MVHRTMGLGNPYGGEKNQDRPLYLNDAFPSHYHSGTGYAAIMQIYKVLLLNPMQVFEADPLKSGRTSFSMEVKSIRRSPATLSSIQL